MADGYRPYRAKYGHHHRELRRVMAERVEAGGVRCARCGQPIEPGTPWDLGHADDGQGYRGAEHRECNRATYGRERPGTGEPERQPDRPGRRMVPNAVCARGCCPPHKTPAWFAELMAPVRDAQEAAERGESAPAVEPEPPPAPDTFRWSAY